MKVLDYGKTPVQIFNESKHIAGTKVLGRHKL